MRKSGVKFATIAFAGAAMLTAGCTASYKATQTDGQIAPKRLDPNGTIYVVLPKDGAYGSKDYGGSGRVVASTIAREFSKKAAAVEVGEQVESRDTAFESAKKSGARYTVVPIIAHWEQRATEWSGRPSRMSVDVAIYDTESHSRVSSRSIIARSRIVSISSTSPESLLTKPVRDYVTALYSDKTATQPDVD